MSFDDYQIQNNDDNNSFHDNNKLRSRGNIKFQKYKLEEGVYRGEEYVIVQYEGSKYEGIVEGTNGMLSNLCKSRMPLDLFGIGQHKLMFWTIQKRIFCTLQCIETPTVMAGGAQMLTFYVPELIEEWG